ncbi:SRPBCC family protein [Knoellia koreensis]|uniref:SRPBCC family protein n=1 Tax=Knoellia koreensis TaxID=2730921 RepID=A0A849HJ79_9MICO|nr:SRPBCC family protein [Knoellia sp. DB2414S]NNM47488.1 SRPBCC family protein [Knoellia sp. DB2414S]
MDLKHSFTVPASVEETWATFMDLEKVGGCFPGATVTEVSDDGFAGTVKVKLGPIALQYAGTGAFTERDDAAHRAVIEAKGKDKRGNGTAGATVTIQLTDAGDNQTKADVTTDLAITGKPAQFGRGVMQDVSDKLLQQFITCIEGKVGGGAEEPSAESTTLTGSDAGAADTSGSAAKTAAATAAAASAATTSAATGSSGDATSTTPPATPTPSPAARPAPSPSRTTSAPAQDDALDLGATVLPVLLRSYAKPLAAVLGAVTAFAVVRRFIRSR